MKMSNNYTKYEVLIKQYLRSILDISALVRPKAVLAVPGQSSKVNLDTGSNPAMPALDLFHVFVD